MTSHKFKRCKAVGAEESPKQGDLSFSSSTLSGVELCHEHLRDFAEKQELFYQGSERSKHRYSPKASLQQLQQEYRTVSASSPLKEHNGQSEAPHTNESRCLWLRFEDKATGSQHTAVSFSTKYALDPAGDRLPDKLSLNLAKPRPGQLLTECSHYFGQLNNIWRMKKGQGRESHVYAQPW